jgi:hypothetical protein
MDPEITLTVQSGDGTRPRPTLLVRLAEMAGLAAIFWGIGIGPLWLIPIGAGLVIASYAAYRRRHGPNVSGNRGPGDPGSDHSGNDDGGSDSGGGD